MDESFKNNNSINDGNNLHNLLMKISSKPENYEQLHEIFKNHNIDLKFKNRQLVEKNKKLEAENKQQFVEIYELKFQIIRLESIINQSKVLENNPNKYTLNKNHLKETSISSQDKAQVGDNHTIIHGNQYIIHSNKEKNESENFNENKITIMALVEQGLDFIFGIVTKNKAVQSFSSDFITATSQWIEGWFLKDDPTAATVMQTEGNEALKKTLLRQKLAELMKNEEFRQELEAHLEKSEAPNPLKRQNVIEDASVQAKTGIRIGNTGEGARTDLDEQNVAKGGNFDTEGAFRLGND